MAVEREAVLNVRVNTGNAAKDLRDVENASEGVVMSAEDVRKMFNSLRSEISNNEKSLDALNKQVVKAEDNLKAMYDKYGEGSIQVQKANDELQEFYKIGTNLETQVDQLNEAYRDLLKSNTDLGASFEDVYGDVRPLTNQIAEMEDRMYELVRTNQQGSQEFKDLQQQVANYRRIIIETDMAVDALASRGKGLTAALQLGEASLAGYGAFQSVLALTGSESEAVIQSLQQLQAVQTGLMSIEQLRLAVGKESALQTNIMAAAQATYTAIVGTSTGALKAFRLALIGTGIGIIVVALGALITNFEGVSKWIGNVTESLNDALRPAIQWVIDTMADLGIIEERVDVQASVNARKATERRAKEIEEINAKAQAVEEAAERERNAVLNRYDYEIALARAAGKDTFELEQQKLAAVLEVNKKEIEALREKFNLLKEEIQVKTALGQIDEEEADRISERIKAIKDGLNALKDERQKTLQQIEVNEVTHNKKLNDDYRTALKERQDAQKAADDLALEAQRMFEDLQVKNIQDANVRKIEELRLQQEREKAALIEKYGQNAALIAELETRQNQQINELNTEFQLQRDEAAAAERENQDREALAQRELRLALIDEEGQLMMAAQLAVWELMREQELANTDLTESERLLVIQKYADQEDALKKKYADAELAREKAVNAAKIEIASNVFGTIGALSSAFAGKSESQQRKAFNINKAVGIAQATIDTYKGAVSAFTGAMQLGPIAGPIVGGILASTVVGMGLANVKKIASQKFSPSGGGGSTPSPASGGGSIPSITSGVQQAQNDINLFGAANQGSEVFAGQTQQQQQVIEVKAEVVETDMTRTQKNVASIESMSSL